ncbi:putative retrotransposon hot spot (RHS) protein, partial [Trypanosoma cruzi]
MPGNQASAVPQGGPRRRARPESEDVTDQPAATHIRVEAQQPQWTMNSTVKEILMEGSTSRTEMKLNDFLRSNLGGRGVVRRNGNVVMEAFVRRPNAYVQDQQLLEDILNLTAYQVYKLHHEGVLSLEQWRDYEGKDTVTPLARGKLNAALTQILTEESREAGERAVREKQVEFTLTTTIRDVLFRGRVRVMEIKLNDFLTMEMDGRGILRANRNVLLRGFFKDPTRYIPDAGVLGEIQATDAYLRMVETVREEMDVEEAVLKLYEKGVDNLLGWSKTTEEVKAGVCDNTKNSLDAALHEVRNPTTSSAPIYLEGCYDSVYNARWHYVVEVPDGEGTVMKVHEGEPPQSWTYRAVGKTFEKDDGVQQSGAPSRLMVLTSDKAWPYRWERWKSRFIHDCYVNCEVERVWRIVKRDLAKWFNSLPGADFTPDPRVLIGTPGIGKSMNAGSYLLYQLLHCDTEQLQMVAYVIADRKFLFDKTAKTVKKYSAASNIVDLLDGFSGRGVKGYIIYDVALKGHEPPAGLPCTGWGMIVVTSPNTKNYESWAKQMDAEQIVMNCPDESDVRAMCVWKEHNGQLEEEEA